MALFNAIVGGLESVLVYVTNLTGSFGLAIIAITLVVKLVFYPLTLKQMRSMAGMRELQPKLAELKEKHGDKPQEYQKRMMDLYKEHNVNPLGGCLPMLAQLPVLIAFFRVLQNMDASKVVEGAIVFLGYWDLTVPDPIYIFPLLAAATTYWQSMLSATDPSQKSMMVIMPVMIGIFSLSFPVGLVLYWIVGNIFTVGQQALINKKYLSLSGGGQSK